MTSTGPITFAAGFASGLFICALILQDACAAGVCPSATDHVAQHVTTDAGLHCVLFDGGRWGSCNWEEFNFRKYQEAQRVHPQISNKEEVPI